MNTDSAWWTSLDFLVQTRHRFKLVLAEALAERSFKEIYLPSSSPMYITVKLNHNLLCASDHI